MTKKSNSFKFIKNVLFVVLVGVAGFVLYDLISTGATDLLTMAGISNIYAQYGIILGAIILLILLSGKSLKKTIKEIAG